jgi:hypothetical protein
MVVSCEMWRLLDSVMVTFIWVYNLLWIHGSELQDVEIVGFCDGHFYLSITYFGSMVVS